MDITKIKAVAELRQNLALAKNIKDEAYEAWKVHNSGYFAAVETLTALVQEAESALRSEALAEYNFTGNKAPGPGVAIKIFEKLEYDPAEAFKWACKHEMALQLNVKAFEKYVKISGLLTDLAFVQFKDDPQAQIAQDLSKYFEEKKEK